MTKIMARAAFDASYSGSYSRKNFVVLSKPIHCATLQRRSSPALPLMSQPTRAVNAFVEQ